MLFRVMFTMWAVFVTAAAPTLALEFHNPQLESQVEALLQGDRDFAEIKLTLDRMVAPGVDMTASLKVIESMAADIERMRSQAEAVSDFDKIAVLTRASILPLFLRRDVVSRYKQESEMRPDLLAYANDLHQQKMTTFAEAEALGWREPSKPF